jgi:hypothetical protein
VHLRSPWSIWQSIGQIESAYVRPRCVFLKAIESRLTNQIRDTAPQFCCIRRGAKFSCVYSSFNGARSLGSMIGLCE